MGSKLFPNNTIVVSLSTQWAINCFPTKLQCTQTTEAIELGIIGTKRMISFDNWAGTPRL